MKTDKARKFIKEMIFSITSAIVIMFAITQLGYADKADYATFLNAFFVCAYAWMIWRLILEFSFPNIDFENEILQGNMAATKIAQTIMILVVVMISVCIIGLNWVYRG